MTEMSRWRTRLSVAGDVAAVVSAVTLLLIVIVVGGTTYRALSRARAAGVAPAGARAAVPAGAGARATPTLVESVSGLQTRANDTIVRPAAARVAVIEFSDFQCPFCARYARNVYPLLKAEFVDTERVAYMMRNFPLEATHPLALRASEAAECAREQGRFWDMYDRLFADQTRLTEPDLFKHAADLGLRAPAFTACLKDGRAAVSKADHAEGVRLGVRSTPTFLIGTIEPDGTIVPRRKLLGALPYETFRITIQQVLAEAGAATRP